jgi:ketopantoate reductase
MKIAVIGGAGAMGSLIGGRFQHLIPYNQALVWLVRSLGETFAV